MMNIPIVLNLIVILFMPVYASAQSPDRIIILEHFGDYDKDKPMIIFSPSLN